MLQLRVDWAELCSVGAFPTWQSNLRPCITCNGCGDGLFTINGCSACELPWHLNTTEDYETATARCEIHVYADEERRRMILRAPLFYDKRKHGMRGRVLRAAIPALGLRQYDRLEATAGLPDVGKLETAIIPPCGLHLVFWRTERDTLTRHRCPIWDEEIGVTPSRVITYDLLHCYCRRFVHPALVSISWVYIKSWGAKFRLAPRGSF